MATLQPMPKSCKSSTNQKKLHQKKDVAFSVSFKQKNVNKIVCYICFNGLLELAWIANPRYPSFKIFYILSFKTYFLGAKISKLDVTIGFWFVILIEYSAAGK